MSTINEQTDSERVIIADIPVNRLTAAEWNYRLISDWEEKKRTGAAPKVMTTINGQVVSLFSQNPAYREAVMSADYIAADGMSVVFASRLVTDTPLAERVSTTDRFHAAAEAASVYGIKFFLLGAKPRSIKRAVRRARRLYPKLQITGWRDGYFDREDLNGLAEQIAQSRADVLWIGVGNPEQVILAHALKSLVPGLVWIHTCGGLFDFLSGDRTRAPHILQQAGLEWAFRVALEPRRLAWRYATTNVRAAYLMARHSGEAAAHARH